MPSITKSSQIGQKQARALCNMNPKERLDFIAEGLPVIYESATSLFAASQQLKKHPREAQILEGFAEEECAKILILVDVARCPEKVISSRIGNMINWFYDHLARLLYAEAQKWKPVSVSQLQEYVDGGRKSHFLEGEFGEYILPNWSIFTRENTLYADVERQEDGSINWSSPLRDRLRFEGFKPASIQIADALSEYGVFSLGGLKILHEVWGVVDFTTERDCGEHDRLCAKTISKLDDAKLISSSATERNWRSMFDAWQMPMYHIDFSKIPVQLEELLERQERMFPHDY